MDFLKDLIKRADKKNTERLEKVFERISHANDEPCHFKNQMTPTTPLEAFELFKLHRPTYWDDRSVQWYTKKTVSKLIYGRWIIVQFHEDKKEYEVIEFDDKYEEMIEHRYENGKRINFLSINAAYDAIEIWKQNGRLKNERSISKRTPD